MEVLYQLAHPDERATGRAQARPDACRAPLPFIGFILTTGAVVSIILLNEPGTASAMVFAFAALFSCAGGLAKAFIPSGLGLLLNLPLVGFFVRVLSLPRWFLIPGEAGMSFVAVYAVNFNAFDLWLMVGFGVVGYFMRKGRRTG